MPLGEGQTIGSYALLRKLGGGAFGEVWLARHLDLGVERAIKVPTAPEYVRQIRQEGRIQFALKHPHVVETFDLNTQSDPPYFVMEYVAGTDLRRKLRAVGKLPGREALGLVDQILAALEAAHGAGIVHRDLKPENILIDAKGQAKVSDFGLGKIQAEAASILMSQSMAAGADALVGTYDYMSPQQRAGQPPVAQDDLYAVGVIACELLTGARPTPGVSVERLFDRARLEKPVARWIEKALDEPQHRYPDARAMRVALREACAPPVKPAPPPIGVAMPPPPPSAPSTYPPPMPPPVPRYHPGAPRAWPQPVPVEAAIASRRAPLEWINASTLGLVLICFFLPLVRVTCGPTVINFNGVHLTFGSMPDVGDEVFGPMPGMGGMPGLSGGRSPLGGAPGTARDRDVPADPLVGLIFLAAIGGAALEVMAAIGRGWIRPALLLVAPIVLVLLFGVFGLAGFRVERDIAAELRKGTSATSGRQVDPLEAALTSPAFMGQEQIQSSKGIGYYLGLLASVVVTVVAVARAARNDGSAALRPARPDEGRLAIPLAAGPPPPV
jgi:predicted nucleic acid-binding protein